MIHTHTHFESVMFLSINCANKGKLLCQGNSNFLQNIIFLCNISAGNPKRQLRYWKYSIFSSRWPK